MSEINFGKEVEALGWRQGSILTKADAMHVRSLAPKHVNMTDDDWLIVISHDCDIVNYCLKKEPFVELLHAQPIHSHISDEQLIYGRNPRVIQFQGLLNGRTIPLSCGIHARWIIPRNILRNGKPCEERRIDNKVRRALGEWVAKRYIRPAFPSEFDLRWKGEKSKNLKSWTKIIKELSLSVSSFYLSIEPRTELLASESYHCKILIAVPAKFKENQDWSTQREEIDQKIKTFWRQFRPGIICDEGEVTILSTDEITLDMLEEYDRFDADWLSFSEDDAPRIPLDFDFRT